MSNRTPTHTYSVRLCDCYPPTARLTAVTFYERGEKHAIRCANCGKVPDSIGVLDNPIPKNHDIVIEISHHIPYGMPGGYYRHYEEVHYGTK